MGSTADLADANHVMRYVPWSKLRRDAADVVLGFFPQAFQLRPDEAALSVNWIKYFPGAATQARDCVWALRRTRNVGALSAFAIAATSAIRTACLTRDVRVRIVHEPREGEPAHASIYHLPAEDLNLLSALAEDAFTEMLRNAEIPPEPGG